MTKQTVFVINSGSSSLKYQLIEPDSGQVLAKGIAERIGQEMGEVTHQVNGEKHEDALPLPTHKEAFNHIIKMFQEFGPDLETAHVVGCGHRVVQGGWYFDGPALIDADTHAKIKELCDLAPLHNPAHLIGIDTAMEMWPDLPHVAAFDTAFFHDLPEETRTYGLQKEAAEKYHIRRYGAHGTSHEYISGLVCDFTGREDVKQITLHLGNGASLGAEIGRHAIDTSMGLTPLEGVVMGTRTGDIDPAVVFHLLRKGMSVDEVDTLFNKQSGMLGLCGNSDMRDVWDRHDKGDPDAIRAMKVYIQRLVKYVGAYTAELGGLEVMTFTAGIGENDPWVRSAVCKKLAFMGVQIDEAVNENLPRGTDDITTISTPDSKVKVLVIPTNEELAIARQVVSLI